MSGSRSAYRSSRVRSQPASHVPVREAFRKLEAQGLIVSKPRCGVRVSHLDPGVVLEVTEMRAALEGLALHHALPRLSPEDLDAAYQALVAGEVSDQVADWEPANRRVHLAITAPCGMSRLMASISDLHRKDGSIPITVLRRAREPKQGSGVAGISPSS